MPKPNLRAVDRDVEHPRERAAREIKRFRTNVERERLPVCNQSTGATNLFVDEILKRTEREMPEQEYRKPFPWVALLAIFIPIVVLVYWIITN